MTGLENRRALEQRISCLDQVVATPQVAVMYLDIDHFKMCNDVYGHAAGDFALRAVASRLAHVVDDRDTVARVGGDEFVILCGVTSAMAAAALAERCRVSLMAPVKFGDDLIRLSASIGVTVEATPNVVAQPEAVLERADRALYEAKVRGRNQVILG